MLGSVRLQTRLRLFLVSRKSFASPFLHLKAPLGAWWEPRSPSASLTTILLIHVFSLRLNKDDSETEAIFRRKSTGKTGHFDQGR